MSDKQLPKFKNYTGQKVNWIQPKLDGHYTKVTTDYRAHIITTSKNPKDITKKLLAIKHIEEELQVIPANSIILCELHCPEEDATSVPTLLNAADERLMLTAFAVPMWDNTSLINPSPDYDLATIMNSLESYGFSVAHATKVIGFIDEKRCDILNEKAILNGFEGHVLKVDHMEGWYKLKPVRELDAFVISTEMSVCDSYYGMLKNVRLSIYKPDGTGHDLGNCGIGVMEEKLKYDTQGKRDALIGRVCEVKYDMIGAKGGMRFPRFVRWRDDEKKKSECTTEQFDYYKGRRIR